MEFLPSIIIQIIILVTGIITTIKIFLTFKITRDISYKYFSIALFIVILHIAIYFVLQLHYIFTESISFLHVGRIVARIFLNVGVLVLMQVPLLVHNTIYGKYRKEVIIILILVIFISTYVQYILPRDAYISNTGFIVENINSLGVVSLIVFIPVVSVIIWVKEIFSLIKTQSIHGFTRIKALLLVSGLAIATLGQVLYLSANTLISAQVAITTILLGYVTIFSSAVASRMRRFFIKN